MEKNIISKMDNTLPLMTGGRLERLAELINQEPAALSTACISGLTDFYNLETLERVLRQVLPERLDIAISIIVKRWEIDVDDHVARVVRYDAELRTFIPYTEDLPVKLEEMKQRIERRRQLEYDLQQEQQALVNLHNSSVTQTQTEPAGVKNQTEAPQFAEGNEAPQEDEVVYHLADLTDEEVRNHILLKTDQQYTCLVEDMCGPVKRWIDNHHFQDLNVVKFTLAKHYIIARNTSVRIFAKLVKHLIPSYGNQEENIKKRKDANQHNWETYEADKNSWRLRNDVKTVEECLANTIQSVQSVA